MGLRDRIGRPWKAALLLAVGAAGGGAALAVASVPDSSGVIHACYQLATINGNTVVPAGGPNLRVIDPSAGQTCSTSAIVGAGPNEATLDWNMRGPPGAAGRPGKTVTITRGNTLTVTLPPLTPGDAAVGGVVFHQGNRLLRSKILSFDVGRDIASGQASGKRQHMPFVIRKAIDSSSPQLLQAAASDATFSKVTLFLVVRKPGAPLEFLVNTMVGVNIVHDSQTSVGSRHSDEIEVVELTFRKISFTLKFKSPPDDWSGPI